MPSEDEHRDVFPSEPSRTRASSTRSSLRKVDCGDSSLKPNFRRSITPEHEHVGSKRSNFEAKAVSKHYALNNQLLEAYDSLYYQKEFRGAYAFGIQYVEVAVLEIPKHGYFYSKRHRHEREENSKNAIRVINQLKSLLKDMESEATSSDWKSDWDRLNLLQKLAAEQATLGQQEIYERDRHDIESELTHPKKISFCGDIFEYVEMFCPGAKVPPEEDLNPIQSDYRPRDISDKRETALNVKLDQSQTPDLRRTLLLSGVSDSKIHEQKDLSQKNPSGIDFQTVYKCYCDDFDELTNEGSVRISQACTYQGRNPGSINGCTVIAPLLFLHHFHNWDDGTMDHGLADTAICEVIDEEAPALLSEVRCRLGLSRDALIIPSDVHDFLIEKELLDSEQFVTVCGGDVLDDAHLSHFVDELQHQNGPTANYSGRKLAASFFFHQHVVVILKLQRSPMEAWYDLIDSLPKQETLGKKFKDSYDEFIPNTSRIRCMGEESLKAALRWYACSRFTEENIAYIDRYDWDDAYADYDPRVFQAYLWAGQEIVMT